MKKVSIYTRVSSLGERQNNERQIADLTTFAEANGMELVKVFNEKISGAVINEKRNVLNECLSHAKNNGISMILFSEVSRLGRDILEIQANVKWLRDNNINAYFQKENITLLDNNGKIQPTTTILIDCLGMVAQIERENIQFRLNSGRELAKKMGVKMGRPTGSKNLADVEKKYYVTLKYIRKGYKPNEILRLARGAGEKVSIATIHRLKKEMKKESV